MTSSLGPILCLAGVLFARTGPAQIRRGDAWLSPPGIYPNGTSPALVQSNLFATLRAEAVAGKIQVTWAPDSSRGPTQVVLHASADAPGHWPARDWRSLSMNLRGTTWSAFLAVEDVEEPILYFVRSVSAGAIAISPMRILLPQEAGLEEPTRPFWPFLEGFEEGFESWRLLSDNEVSLLGTSTSAKSGRAALMVRMPSGRRSLTLVTTRVRGWLAEQKRASGICLWLRTAEGAGRARFSVLAHAFTTNEVSRVWPADAELSERWRRVDLYFDQLPSFPLRAMDIFSIEFIADGTREFLVDDVQLLGPWPLDPP